MTNIYRPDKPTTETSDLCQRKPYLAIRRIIFKFSIKHRTATIVPMRQGTSFMLFWGVDLLLIAKFLGEV